MLKKYTDDKGNIIEEGDGWLFDSDTYDKIKELND